MTAKKPPEEHKKDGVPTRYRPRYHNEAARKLAVLGMIDAEIAEQFELSEKQLNVWKQKYPKFGESIRAGREPANAAVADSLRQRAIGFEWMEEVPTKIKRVEYNEAGKKVAEYEEVVITKVKRVVPPDTPAASLFLRNRKSAYWRDKVEVEHSGEIGSKAERIRRARGRAGVADGDSAAGA